MALQLESGLPAMMPSALEWHWSSVARRDAAEVVVECRLAGSIETAVMGIFEEHDLGLGQPERLPSVHQVRGDDAAEREPEVAGAVEFRLHPRGVGGEVLERAVDAVERGRHARLDVERSRARHGVVGLPAGIHDDRSVTDRVADELVHLVETRVLEVSVHHDRHRRRGRSRVDRLEHEPRVGPFAAAADAPVAVLVVAAAGTGDRLWRLDDRRSRRARGRRNGSRRRGRRHGRGRDRARRRRGPSNGRARHGRRGRGGRRAGR